MAAVGRGERMARHTQRARYTRRTALWAGVSLGGAFALACGSSKTTDQQAARATSAAPPAPAAPAPAVASLIGRTAPPATEQPLRGGVHTTSLPSNPPTLDPHQSSSINTANAVSGVYSRPLRLKTSYNVAEAANREVEPDLAVSVESADAVTWTVKLRPDAKFQNIAPVNGRPVEAEDVKTTYTRALGPNTVVRGALGMIDPAQIETPDRQTVVFKLRYPYAPFKKLLASGVYSWIMPREVAAGLDPAKQAIGSGPFLLDNYTPDVALSYKRNLDWFDKSGPYVDGVRVAIIPEATQRLAQFTAGNLDYTAANNEDVAALQQQNAKADLLTNWAAGALHIYMQLGEATSPFQDIRLRQAVSLAFDRETYGKVFYEGKYQPGFTVPLSLGKSALKLEDLPADVAQWYRFDLARAKKLVEEAGGQQLQLKFLKPTPYTGDPQYTAGVEMIVNMLNQLPWKVTLVPIDYNKDYIGGGKGASYGFYPVDSLLFLGVGGQDVDETIFSAWNSKSQSNRSRINDPQIDAMIDKARTIVDDGEATKAYLEIQKYHASKVYTVSGNPSGVNYSLVAARVRNYTVGDNYGVGTGTWAKLWLRPA